MTKLEKQLVNEYKKGNYMLFWVGKYKRRFTFMKKQKEKAIEYGNNCLENIEEYDEYMWKYRYNWLVKNDT